MGIIDMGTHQVIRTTVLHIQVCSIGTEQEALDWVKKYSPAGTTGNWGLQTKHPPVDCESIPGRRHYLFQC